MALEGLFLSMKPCDFLFPSQEGLNVPSLNLSYLPFTAYGIHNICWMVPQQSPLLKLFSVRIWTWETELCQNEVIKRMFQEHKQISKQAYVNVFSICAVKSVPTSEFSTVALVLGLCKKCPIVIFSLWGKDKNLRIWELLGLQLLRQERVS